jgi:hypothetical protein
VDSGLPGYGPRMTRENVGLEDLERQTEEPQPAPPAPVQAPEQLAWASAVGNQAVQRLARSVAVARQPVGEEEQVPQEEEEPAAEASPEGEPAPAGEEELPEELPE